MAAEQNISVGDIQVNGDRSVTPSESKVIASFNWSSSSTSVNPHIIVPGAPRMFVPPKGRGFTLAKEYGDPVGDNNNSSIHPFIPHEALFHSLRICAPDFDLDSVDIVTERSNLRNLHMFCGSPGDRTSSYTPNSFRTKPFRFLVHGIGGDRDGGPTLVFSRVATGREEHYPGYYGSFVKKHTKMDPSALPDAESFCVVVKMDLDGMSLLVRSNVDAVEIPKARRSSTHDKRNIQDDLSVQLGGLLVSSGAKTEGGTSPWPGKGSCPSDSEDSSITSGLTSTRSGQLLGDEAQLLTFKTKNERYAHEINWEDYYWLMALGDGHKLMLGLHNCGDFDGVQQLPIDKVKARADENGSSSMVYLANTLREVIKAAHCLMAAPSSPSGAKGEKGSRPVVVVEFMTTMSGDGTLRVRLAAPGDGDVTV